MRPQGSCGVRWGWGRAGPSVVVCPSCVWVLVPAVVSSFSAPRSPFLPLPGPWEVSCSHVVSLPVPCPYGRLPVTWGPPVPPCRSVPFCPCPPLARALPLPGVVVAGCGGGADGPGLGVGGLEPFTEGLGGVGGAEALDRVLEEGLPCRLRHDGLRGGLVGVGGGAGADLLEGVHHVHPFSPSRSPGPLHPAVELLQGGGRPPGEVGVGLGRGGVRARGPGLAGGGRGHAAVAGVAVPGGAGAAMAGLRVGDRYGRPGEREARWAPWGEGPLDMGRRWPAWRRLGERERWCWGLGVGVAYGQRGEREAGWGLWWEAEMDMGRRWRASWCLDERER